jgi:hypothetical protein
MPGSEFLVAGAAVLAGPDRGEDRPPEKKWGEPGYAEDQVVQMQLCLPTRKIAFDTLPVDLACLDVARRRDRYHTLPDLTPEQLLAVDKTVRIPRLSGAADGVSGMNMPADVWSRHGDVVGSGPASMSLVGGAALAQPVFEGNGYHPEHCIAIHSRTLPLVGKSAAAGPQYWFELPKEVSLSMDGLACAAG